jgi:hypothetical protein
MVTTVGEVLPLFNGYIRAYIRMRDYVEESMSGQGLQVLLPTHLFFVRFNECGHGTKLSCILVYVTTKNASLCHLLEQ